MTLAWRAILCTRGNPLRAAFFAEYTETNRKYIPMDAAQTLVDGGRPLVSANFVVSYPPGFPILVPGQVVSTDILDFLRRVDVKEIHGYRPELGLPVFTETARDLLELLRGNLADIPDRPSHGDHRPMQHVVRDQRGRFQQ